MTIFTCRFTKHNPSSTRKEGLSSEKRRKTKVRLPNLCQAKIRVLRLVTEQKILVERFQGSSEHAHTIEESEKLKRSQVVRSLVEKEAVKNYPSPTIVNAIKEYAAEEFDLGDSIRELR